jgi:hypothetical protein
MTHQDGHDREMAKWAHHRLDTTRQRAEADLRQALDDLADTARSGPQVTAPQR